jgi:uncharacterized protein YndB with AHSA1/START domain
MMTLAHTSFTIKRSFGRALARVFEAFANQDKKHVWFVASDGPEWTTKHYGLDFKVGGRERGQWVGPDGVVHSASLTAIQFHPDGTGSQLTYCGQVLG